MSPAGDVTVRLCSRCGVVHDPQFCQAHAKSSGRQCGRRPVIGATVCIMHGGSAPQVKAAAARTIAFDRAIRELQLGGELDVDPAEAMLQQVREAAANVAILRHLVATLNPGYVDQGDTQQLEGVDGEPPHPDDIDRSELGGALAGRVDPANWKAAPHVWVVMYNEERDRLVRFCKLCRDAGVEEHRVQLADRMATQLVEVQHAVVAAVLDSVRRMLHTSGVTEAGLAQLEQVEVPGLVRQVVEARVLSERGAA